MELMYFIRSKHNLQKSAKYGIMYVIENVNETEDDV